MLRHVEPADGLQHGLHLLRLVHPAGGRKEEYGIGIVGTAASLAAVVLMGLLFFGPSKSLLTAPAAFVREGIHMNTLPLGTVQAVLAVLIVAGFVAVAIEAVRFNQRGTTRRAENARAKDTTAMAPSNTA